MIKARGAAPAIYVWITLLATGASTAANADGQQAPAGHEGISLNQAASLEEPDTSDAADIPLPASGSVVRDASSADVAAKRPARSAPTEHRVGRTGLSPRPGKITGPRHTPWYRTGFGALAIVLALVGGMVWIFRRWLPQARADDGRLVRIVSRANLTPKHSVVLIGLGRRFLLVGVSGDRVSPLAEVADPEEVAELTLRLNGSGSGPAGPFDDVLLREAAEYGRSAPPQADPAAPTQRRHRGACESVGELLRKLRALQSK